DRRGELAEAGGVELRAVERLVGRAEVDRAGLDLGDAAARADRPVIDLVAGGGVVVGGPLRHQREDERRAGAGDLRGDAIARGGGGGAVGAGGGAGGLRLLVRRLAGGEAEGDRQGQDGETGR